MKSTITHRVGEMMTAPISCFFKGVSRRKIISTAGRTKAKVLPDPVTASTHTSYTVDGDNKEGKTVTRSDSTTAIRASRFSIHYPENGLFMSSPLFVCACVLHTLLVKKSGMVAACTGVICVKPSAATPAKVLACKGGFNAWM